MHQSQNILLLLLFCRIFSHGGGNSGSKNRTLKYGERGCRAMCISLRRRRAAANNICQFFYKFFYFPKIASPPKATRIFPRRRRRGKHIFFYHPPPPPKTVSRNVCFCRRPSSSSFRDLEAAKKKTRICNRAYFL